jgi:hypothetical protein
MGHDMNESHLQKLREENWRRKLTAEEEAGLNEFLFGDPQAQADWEADAGLTHVLSQLPPAPVSSNFTAQVMSAVDHETGVHPRRVTQALEVRQWLRQCFPRIAWAALPAIALLLVYAGYEFRQIRRAELAESVVQVSTVASVIKPETFKDFEAIALLSQLTVDDSAFVRALK